MKFGEQWQGLIGVGELLEGFASFLSGSLVFHKIAGSGFDGINRAFNWIVIGNYFGTLVCRASEASTDFLVD